MTDSWDSAADGWDDNADVRHYSEMAFAAWQDRLCDSMPDLAQGRVLDFGCGTGLLAEKFAPLCRQVVAIDPSAAMIDVLKTKIAGREFENITALPITVDADNAAAEPALAEPFDLIVASSVCSFLADYEATLQTLTTLLKPGGVFVQWDWAADMPETRIRSAFDKAGLRADVIAEVFAMEMGDSAMPVVMGAGQVHINAYP